METEEYWFWLASVPEMWQGKIRRLLSVFSNPEEIYTAAEKTLECVPGLKKKDRAAILKAKQDMTFHHAYEKMRKQEIWLCYPGHPDYPERLYTLSDYPYTLFVKGKMPDQNRPMVGIVGSRDSSSYGVCMTERLAKSLAGYRVQTISGLARGIDGACHRGTLAGKGETFAVLGNGVDICYPRENRILYDGCAEQGGILSEYPPGRPPFAWQFPLRNRIISGLCDLLVVMEAKERSGSLITVDYALEQGKDVFALPGRVTDARSVGCNRLLKAGAMMLTDTSDILLALGIEETCESDAGAVLTEAEKRLYDVLDFAPETVDALAAQAGVMVQEARSILTDLVIKKVAGEQMKCFYKKKLL